MIPEVSQLFPQEPNYLSWIIQIAWFIVFAGIIVGFWFYVQRALKKLGRIESDLRNMKTLLDEIKRRVDQVYGKSR